MKAVIIAGGLGTRLRPVTYEIPKALIPIQGKTLTEHIIDILKKGGVTEVYLSIGYLKEQIKAYFSGKDVGIPIQVIEENEPLGTGGWMHLVERFTGDFIVLNGDNLYDIDVRKFVAFHQEHGAVATDALLPVEDPSPYGIVEMDGDRIRRFVEKPSREEAPSNLANTGWYVFNEKVFDYLPEQKKFMFEKDLFPKLAEAGLLFGFPYEAQWSDTGTFEKWEDMIMHWRKQ